MSVSANYATPVMVNGYSCKNCTEVDEAKKGIDPAHPKDGPYGVDKKDDPTEPTRDPAVTFGGSLANLLDSRKAQSVQAADPATNTNTKQSVAQASTTGAQVDISV